MKKSPAKKSPTSKTNDPRQEKVIKGFSELLSAIGITVRREELKRGLGWRAQSGRCKAKDNKLLFVDRRTLLSEQAAILSQAIYEHRNEINEDLISKLNVDAAEKVRELVS